MRHALVNGVRDDGYVRKSDNDRWSELLEARERCPPCQQCDGDGFQDRDSGRDSGFCPACGGLGFVDDRPPPPWVMWECGWCLCHDVEPDTDQDFALFIASPCRRCRTLPDDKRPKMYTRTVCPITGQPIGEPKRLPMRIVNAIRRRLAR